MPSIWEKETWFEVQDVIIAGSGFTGLWSALYLKKSNPDLKVTVIDSGWIPAGASTRNAGIACFGSLSEVVFDASVMGTDKMLWLVEMRYKGLERIRKYFKKSEIDFDFCGGYELYDYSDKVTTEQLRHNIEYINSLFKSITGVKNTYRLSDKKIKSFGFGNTKHLVKNILEGCLHPGKLLHALLSEVQGMGVKVLSSTEIRSYEVIQELVHIDTDHAFTFKAKQFLICTNAFTKNIVP
ncbi:MAG: NAD(P)/FAD-dependent oxidoreductase, partial [Flavisolibacter sp.]